MYILSSGAYINAYTNKYVYGPYDYYYSVIFRGDCISLIGTGDVNIYSNYITGYSNSMVNYGNTNNNLFIDNIHLDGENDGI